MTDRAAIVTGASRGIGLAIAKALAEEGYGLTMTARKPETLEAVASGLRASGYEIEHVVGNIADEAAIIDIVKRHRERFGRLDVLINNAGVGIATASDDHNAKHIDLQFAVNIRAIILFYRECGPMLRAAGAEHRNAVVVNMASLAGKSPQPPLSIYSATKAAVIAYTRAMNQEFNSDGVKSVAFCPGFVDTDMSDFVKQTIPADEMLQTSDITKALRFVLALSTNCVVPDIVFERPGENI